ncbi:hypothetical protein OAD61_00675 [bacterium]|nr:hypothetical protein [bacterium]
MYIRAMEITEDTGDTIYLTDGNKSVRVEYEVSIEDTDIDGFDYDTPPQGERTVDLTITSIYYCNVDGDILNAMNRYEKETYNQFLINHFYNN